MFSRINNMLVDLLLRFDELSPFAKRTLAIVIATSLLALVMAGQYFGVLPVHTGLRGR